MSSSTIVWLFVLAAAAPAIQTLQLNEQVKKNLCPPLGLPGSEYEITVLSADNLSLGGCVVPREYVKSGDFEMWLDVGGNCSAEEMKYFHFNCISTWEYSDPEPTNWTYVLLEDTTVKENTSRRPVRCALYRVFDDGARILMAIAGENIQNGTGCEDAAIFVNLPDGDSDIVASSLPNRPIFIQLDRTDAVPNSPVPERMPESNMKMFVNSLNRKKRSPINQPDFNTQIENTCRFPEYTQGQWSNLRIDGGAIRYVYVYNADDFDNEEMNNDSENQGEDGDAELLTRRRTRRETSSTTSPELMQTIETIENSIASHPTNFSVEKLIKLLNLTDFPIKNELEVLIINLVRGNKNITQAINNKNESTVSTNTPQNYQPISPFDDFDDNWINKGSNIHGHDGEEVIKRRRNRREIPSLDLLQTVKAIKNIISPYLTNFSVEEFAKKHNLTDFPADNLDVMFKDFLKTINNITVTSNESELPVSSETPSRKRRLTSPNDDDEDEATKVDRFRKIARIERLWDEQLRNDIQRAFETFDYYGFPDKIHQTVNKVPNNPSAQANPAVGDPLKKPILEAWNSFKSLFGFSVSDDEPIFPPTPPSSPPPTPPNTPPRPSEVMNDHGFGIQIGSLLNDQTNKQNNYVEYNHDGNLKPVERKKRCFGSDETTTTKNPISRFGEFDEQNRDKTLDTIDKFNKEHDVLHNDKGPSRNENIPVVIMDQLKKRNVETSYKSTETSPSNALEKILYKIGNFFKDKKPESVQPKGPAGIGYTLDFQDYETVRQKRSARDDYEEQMAMEYAQMEEDIRRAPIIAEERSQKFMSWWTDYRNNKMEMYRRKYDLGKELDEVEYHKYPEMRPTPSAVEFLDEARTLGVPYKLALIQWRSLEREHRMWLANLEYIAFPGQNHPDVSLGDFDHTYDDIELEFDPQHPEGTAEDPTAYRVYTVPGGGPRITSKQSRRAVWEQKHKGIAKPSDSDDYYTIDDDFVGDYVDHDVREDNKPSKTPDRSDSATFNGQKIKDRNIADGPRVRRSADERPSQTMGPQKFAWRCVHSAQDFGDPETTGAKFLTMGGRINDEDTEPALSIPQNDEKTNGEIHFDQEFGCLWLVPRGPNVLEFSILATGRPKAGQDMKSFTQELCTESQIKNRDSRLRTKNKLRPRRRWWFTETRPEEKNRVQVSCPVPPGTVFYGVVPAPPPPQSSDPNAAPSLGSRQMCARLVSAADDCKPGEAGRLDRMKYTVSDCVEQQITTDGSLPQEVIAPPKPQDVFEERAYQCLGQWTEMQQNGPGENSALLTYTFVKRIDSSNPGAPEYECFVGTTVPNDPDRNPATTTTLMLTEAGTGNRCSRLADPFKSGMKLIGTKIGQGAACAGNGRSGQNAPAGGGSWYPLQPQELPAGADKGAGKSAVTNPSTMPPAVAGSSTWNPVKKDKEPVFVRPVPPPKENSAAVFKHTAVAIIAVLVRFFMF